MTSTIGDASLESWERHTAAGFRAMSHTHWSEAADEWRKAFDHVRASEPWDARRAAGLNNLGVAYLLDARYTEAEDYFDNARDSWARTEAYIPDLDVPVVGHSSVFHLRLATRHHDAFADSRRRRCVQLCAAASAITNFNAALAQRKETSSPLSLEVAAALIRNATDAFGARCPELKLMENGDSEPLYREKALRAFDLQARSMAAALSPDYRRLEMATNLTALLSPRLLGLNETRSPKLDGPEQ
jgi:hypothetical protein